MKNMFLILFFVLTACSGSDNNGNPEENGFIKFEIDGDSYNFTGEAEGGYFPDSSDESFFQADAVDENNSKNNISFRISGDLAEKEYVTDKSLIWITFNDVQYSAVSFDDKDFKVTITDLGEEGEMVRGTFSGTLENDSDSDVDKTFKVSGSFSVFRNYDSPVE
ncbi:MAG: hypothetical protein KA015_02260 [Spirochaetes bacterium]|nr:hypothetical protein [Spirochaetota bacterium]